VLKNRARSMPPNRILVLTGPGSFSATRAAVNIANALGYTWHVPVVGVHGPATLPELRTLLSDLDRTHVPDGFEIEHRALPFYPKPVELGRRSTKQKRAAN